MREAGAAWLIRSAGAAAFVVAACASSGASAQQTRDLRICATQTENLADQIARNFAMQGEAEAAFVANRLRERGILLGTDGPHHNVIKIRPPMPFTESDGDLVVEELERAVGALDAR